MLSEKRARRLARRAGRRHRDGSRGWRARRAWRRLTEAGDRGDASAVEAAWQAWLREPGDELWALLSHWREPAALAGAAFGAAVEPDRAPSGGAAIGAFCARHGMAPGDAVARALFFSLTGQDAQRRAMDPDGRLLAAAYHAASQSAQAAVREAISGSGDLDLVRVIAGQRDRGAPLTADERPYLAGQLAGRRDWPGLWRLIQDFPLAEAVAATRVFPGGWRPADEAEQRLLGLLAAASPDTITQVASGAARRVTVRDTFLDDIAFSPDGSQLAVAERSGIIAVYDIAGDRLIRHYRTKRVGICQVLHLGDAVVHAEPDEDKDLWHVVRNGWPGSREVLLTTHLAVGPPALAHVPGGFAAAHWESLWFGTAGGSGLRQVRLPDLGLAKLVHQMTADPATGRLAVATVASPGMSQLTVLDADLRVLGQVLDGHTRWLGFCGPGLLLAKGWRGGGGSWALRSWYVASPLVAGAVRDIDDAATVRTLPRSRQAAVSPGNTAFLDADTLIPVAGPPGLGHVAPYVSPGGEYAAVHRRIRGSRVVIDVYDLRLSEIARLAAAPLASAGPADLRAVTDAAALDVPPAVSEAIGVLRACLEQRFGADVTISRGTPEPAVDDIALSGGDLTC